ncbi:MAG: hypothetical protein JNM39_01695 [Bdellovibrionaceae bacterium]|nr:hypothetical protein [Pseudobdellovibrionaceae bacterium]
MYLLKSLSVFVATGLVSTMIVSQAQALDQNDDVKILSSQYTLVSFLPRDSGKRIETNPNGPGMVLNTNFCTETKKDDTYGSTTQSFDCNSAYAEAFGKPLLNHSSWDAEVQKTSYGSTYSRNSAYVYAVTVVVKAAAFYADSFRGVGLHAHGVTFWEALYNQHWGVLVGSNDAEGGFISKSKIAQIKREVTLKNGEKAFAFDAILAQMSLVNGASKPTYVGLTIRPNVKFEANGQEFIQWDNTQFDYFIGRNFDRSNEILQ